jgi:hypothetical protein
MAGGDCDHCGGEGLLPSAGRKGRGRGIVVRRRRRRRRRREGKRPFHHIKPAENRYRDT